MNDSGIESLVVRKESSMKDDTKPVLVGVAG